MPARATRAIPPARLPSARLSLRSAAYADAKDLERLLEDPEVTRFLPPARRNEPGREFVRRVRQRAREGSGVTFVVRTRGGGQFLGFVAVFGIQRDVGRCEIGYAMSRAEWGRGYATEAVGAVVDWTFASLRLRRIDAQVVGGNAASAAVLRRLGFRGEGTRREAVLDRGAFVDLLEFGLLASDRPDPAPGARSRAGRRGG